jgi:hypothetical protein
MKYGLAWKKEDNAKDSIFVGRTWRTLKYVQVFIRDYATYDELEEVLGQLRPTSRE